MKNPSFEFDEKKHVYTLDGKKLTGVTSVIAVLAKPALIGWAARMTAEYVREHWTPECKFGVEEIEQILEKEKSSHNQKKESAGVHGTDAHALVEEWINEMLVQENAGRPLPLWCGYESIKPFIDWAVENVDHFLFCERRMFNKDMWVAGTADFGCVLKTGQRLIGDFKTSSGVYGIDYYLQCAGYKMLAESEGDEPYSGCVIVRLGKKGPKDFDVIYNYDTKTAEEAFRACLVLYRAQETLKATATT